jgi:hypothetical protein
MSHNKLLTAFQIRMLLKCNERPVSKYYLSNPYRKYRSPEYTAGLQALIQEGFLEEKELPRVGAIRTPVSYFITEKWREWVKRYKESKY